MGDSLADAVDRFEAACRKGRELVEAVPRFQDRPDHRAQAYVALAEARAMAYNLVLSPRLDHPHVHSQNSWYSYIFGLGTTCPDFRYGALLLDGREGRTYRLRGNVGDCKLSLFQVFGHIMGHPDAREIGNHDLVDLAGDDGIFDLTAGAHGQIPLVADGTSFFLIRRILTDVSGDPGTVEVEQVDGPPPGIETDDAVIAERFDLAAHLMTFLVRQWIIGCYDMYIAAAGGKNQLAYFAGEELTQELAGSPSTTYGLAVYDLEPEEALLVEWDPPDSDYWSFQLGDVWSNPLDFKNRQTDVSLATATLDPDGRLRAVVAHHDTGHANWMDPCGRTELVFVVRNYKARGESATPVLTRVAAHEIGDHLPAATATVTDAEREAALDARRGRFRAAFGD